MWRAELDQILFSAFTAEVPNTFYTREMRFDHLNDLLLGKSALAHLSYSRDVLP